MRDCVADAVSGKQELSNLDGPGLDPLGQFGLSSPAGDAEFLADLLPGLPLRAGSFVIFWDGQRGQPVRST